MSPTLSPPAPKHARAFRTLARGGYPATITEILRAQNEGYRALIANAALSSCPYKGDSEKGRYLALMWFRGWSTGQEQALSAAPPAVAADEQRDPGQPVDLSSVDGESDHPAGQPASAPDLHTVPAPEGA